MSVKDDLIQPDRGQDAIAIHLVNSASYENFAKGLSGPQRVALAAQKFTGAEDQLAVVPDGDGWFALGGVSDPSAMTSWCMARLAQDLPAGTYRCASGQPGAALHGWQSAQYVFDRYKQDDQAEGPRILLASEVGRLDSAIAEAQAAARVMDLVNTPAEDMGPAALEAEADAIAKANGATINAIRGDALETGFPMVHAVGRGAARHHAPRLIQLQWGRKDAPRVALVGKGVCFDSGGLDIKNAASMLLMKKDMGGAAHVLALADLVMRTGLDVNLSVYVPAVENAVAGNSFRPGDILRSRKGLSVEIGNTDAEGRLILADALALASEQEPELVIDFATLTGAARVALGPDLPAMFARRDETAADLLTAGLAHDDPCWRLPLHEPYAKWLKSDVADTNNISGNSFAGSSVAALFLDKFVGDGIDWAHFDTFAWRPSAKPGRPKGGAALGLRAAFHALRNRYSRG